MEPSLESAHTLERSRERIYWYSSLLLIVASPAILFYAVKADDGLQWQKPGPIQFLLGSFPGLLAAICFEGIISRAQGRPLRLWQKNPTVTFAHCVALSPAACAADILFRLGQERFVAQASPDARHIEFRRKGITTKVGFEEHEFSGDAVLSPMVDGTNVQMTLVFRDTVLIETGETEKLREMAARLCGAPISPPAREVSLLLVSGLANGLLALLLLLVPHFRHGGFSWLLAMIVGSVGVSLLGLNEIRNRPGRLFGVRLGIAAIYLGLTPVFAMVWKLWF